MKCRSADRADLENWARMRSKLWPDSADHHLAELQQYFAGDSIDIEECFLMEDAQGRIAGFIEINLRNFAEGSRSPQVPYVEAWYIEAEYRERGYGKLLMDRAEQWALDRGFSELASDTEIDNAGSIAIHKHLGFKETERVVCFLKRLKNN